MPFPLTRGEVAPASVEISVVVSTRNRAANLPRLFDALERQTFKGAWELVIVDNDSSDETPEVIGALASRHSFPVVQAVEHRRGKAYALNAGIRLARGTLTAFTDDDAIPAPDWLERITARFAADPTLRCLGGRVELLNPEDAPITVRLSRQPSVVDRTNYAPSNIPVIGCNMAFRSETLRNLGLFDVVLGPGSKVRGYEDTDLLYRVVSSGHRIHYDPDLLVHHDHGRRAEADVAAVRSDYSSGRGGFYTKWLMRGDTTVMRWAYWDLRTVFIDIVRYGVVTGRARREWRELGLSILGAARYLRYSGQVDRT
ncbi:MAG TPA: glycosyltransferase family A protein [Gemmatimonadaceae bacterium]|nr:glycosyltransferase family A protein [Gemmatimonadaceae bacterium]